MRRLQDADTRLLELATKAGVPTQDRLPRLFLRSEKKVFHDDNDLRAATQLIKKCHLRAEQKAPWRTKRSSILDFRCATAELVRVVDNRGPVGIASALMAIGGTITTISDPETRRAQTQIRQALLRKAVEFDHVELVELLASMASKLQLITPLITALSHRKAHIVQILLESGADPNDVRHFTRNATQSGDHSVLGLLLRAPKRLTNTLLLELLEIASSSRDLKAISLLLQAEDGPETVVSRQEILQHAVRVGDIQLFMTVLYHTRNRPAFVLSGLPDLVINHFNTYGFVQSDVVEALCCFQLGSNLLQQCLSSFLVQCVQYSLHEVVRLLVEYDVPVNLAAVKATIVKQDLKALDLLLCSQQDLRQIASQSMEYLSEDPVYGLKWQFFWKLLDKGANGNSLDGFLTVAVAAQDQNMVRRLLASGASPGQRVGELLITAIRTGALEIAEMLLAADVSLEVLQSVFPATAELRGVKKSSFIKLLLAKGAAGEVVDIALRTAVCVEDIDRDSELIDALLTASASPSWNNGESLRHAISRGDMSMFKILYARCCKDYQDVLPHIIPLISDVYADNHMMLSRIVEIILKTGPESPAQADDQVFFDAVASQTSMMRDTLDDYRSGGSVIEIFALHGDPVLLKECIYLGPAITAEMVVTTATALIESTRLKDHDWLFDRLQLICPLVQGMRPMSTTLLRYILRCEISNLAPNTRVIAALADVSDSSNVDFAEACLRVVSLGWTDAFNVLLDKAPPIEIRDECFRQAIDGDYWNQTPSACVLLLEAGLSETVRLQALSKAVDGKGRVVLLQLLLRYGADVNHNGGRPAIIAVEHGNLQFLTELLSMRNISAQTLSVIWTALETSELWDGRKLVVLDLMFELVPINRLDLCLEQMTSFESFREDLASKLLRKGVPATAICLSRIVRTGNIKLFRQALLQAELHDINVLFRSTNEAPFAVTNINEMLQIALSDITMRHLVTKIMASNLSDNLSVGLADSKGVEMITLLSSLDIDANQNSGQLFCDICRLGCTNAVEIFLSKDLVPETVHRGFAYLLESRLPETELIRLMKVFALAYPGLPSLTDSTDFGTLWYHALRCRPNRPNVIRCLLEICPVRSDKIQSLLCWTIQQTSPWVSNATVRAAMNKFGPFDSLNEHIGRSLLFEAVRSNRHELIGDILMHGVDIQVWTPNGETPLMLASRLGFTNVVARLLRAGAPANDGSLHDALNTLHVDIALRLLESGHDVNHTSACHNQRTPLVELCSLHQEGLSESALRRWQDIICFLISKAGADPFVEFGGKSAIFHALDLSSHPTAVVEAILLGMTSRKNATSRLEDLLYQSVTTGLVYSPLTYIEFDQANDNWNTALSYEALRVVLEKYKVPKVYYAIHGPQPEEATNIPRSITHPHEEVALLAEILSRSCEVCGEHPIDVHSFHATLTQTCTHKSTVIICSDCLDEYLTVHTTRESGRVSTSVSCWAPDCHETLTHGDLRRHLPADKFEAYDLALVHQVIHEGQSFIECAYADCSGSGWCDPSTMSFVRCETCLRSTCIACQTPQHSYGTICPQSAEGVRRREEEREEQEAAAKQRGEHKKQNMASAEEVKKSTKDCPNDDCGAPIMKNGGCDHMTCKCYQSPCSLSGS